jgi:hypothetical protein
MQTCAEREVEQAQQLTRLAAGALAVANGATDVEWSGRHHVYRAPHTNFDDLRIGDTFEMPDHRMPTEYDSQRFDSIPGRCIRISARRFAYLDEDGDVRWHTLSETNRRDLEVVEVSRSAHYAVDRGLCACGYAIPIGTYVAQGVAVALAPHFARVYFEMGDAEDANQLLEPLEPVALAMYRDGMS